MEEGKAEDAGGEWSMDGQLESATDQVLLAAAHCALPLPQLSLSWC